MVPKNTAATMECVIKMSNPTATWTWEFQKRICIAGSGNSCKPSDKNWAPLPKNHQITPPSATPSKTSVVQIPSKQGEAFYRCTAKNQFGSDKQTRTFLRDGT